MEVKYLINTMTAWEEPPRARHQVTSALAKKHKVAFVASNKIGWPRVEISTLNNIVLVQPYFPVNLKIRYRLPIVNETYQYWLFSKLRKKFNRVDVVNFDFSAYLIHKFFKKVYFYCNDNFTAISKKINNSLIYKYHIYCERNMASKASLCIGTSPIILEKLKPKNINSHLILLGGPDISEFDVKPAPKREAVKTIHLGLVGFIKNYNLSYKLINSILEQINCQITLIGPVEEGFLKNIKDKNRIILKGVLTGQQLIEEVNKFDVAIAPYADSKINEGGIPNKLLIYLALGKPVVVTELMSLKQISLPENLIYLVKENDDFPKLIIKAHAENSDDLISKRINYARENTWDIRIDEFLDLVRTNSLVQ